MGGEFGNKKRQLPLVLFVKQRESCVICFSFYENSVWVIFERKEERERRGEGGREKGREKRREGRRKQMTRKRDTACNSYFRRFV